MAKKTEAEDFSIQALVTLRGTDEYSRFLVRLSDASGIPEFTSLAEEAIDYYARHKFEMKAPPRTRGRGRPKANAPSNSGIPTRPKGERPKR